MDRDDEIAKLKADLESLKDILADKEICLMDLYDELAKLKEGK